MNDEIAPTPLGGELAALGLEHLGSDTAHHDALLVNRTTGGLLPAKGVAEASHNTP
ncbi:MAG: hypothetical protein ACR2RB_07710 [Gammaproteobacteria bacterium]